MASRSPHVTLAAVDEDVLDRLVEVATSDAEPNEVTPPRGEAPGWNLERTAWLRDFHRAARAGLDGPAGDATWAVLVDGDVAGQVRLRRPDDRGMLETGYWIARSARRRGVGRTAVALAVAEARRYAVCTPGVNGVRAATTTDNVASQAILRSLGFELRPGAGPGAVEAELRF
jgi:ribosomal-protein-alanine N-acetyltransferase